MDKLLDYLAEVEGTTIHHNTGEDDITLPYGIYLKHSSELYKWILSQATEHGLPTETKYWHGKQIEYMNIIVEKNKLQVRAMAKRFYQDFLKNAHIELFPKECQVAMHSMYTNSPKLSWKAVQEALIEFDVCYNFQDKLEKGLSIIDGSFGEKTRDALNYIRKNFPDQGYHFETRMLSNMKSLYIKLWKREEEKLQNKEVSHNKYARYLSGWDNRVSKLEMMR